MVESSLKMIGRNALLVIEKQIELYKLDFQASEWETIGVISEIVRQMEEHKRFLDKLEKRGIRDV